MAQNNFDKAEFQKKVKNNVKRLYRKYNPDSNNVTKVNLY